MPAVNNKPSTERKNADNSKESSEDKPKKKFIFRPKDPYILSQTVQKLITNGKFEQAHDLLLNVPVSEQNAIAWSILINASANQKRVKLSWLLFNQVDSFTNYQMKKRGMTPTPATYTHLIRSFTYQPTSSNADKVGGIRQFLTNSSLLSIQHANALLSFYRASKNIENLLELVGLLEAGKLNYIEGGNTTVLHADQVSYTVGLKALHENSRFPEALKLFKVAREQGLVDGHLLYTGLNMCNECPEKSIDSEWQDIMDAVVKWQSHGEKNRGSSISAKPWFEDEHSRGIVRLVMKAFRGRGDSLGGVVYFLNLLEQSFYADNLSLQRLGFDVREFAFCTTLIVDTLNTSS
jgi:hypothetical protein